jgi:hypothetical protein
VNPDVVVNGLVGLLEEAYEGKVQSFFRDGDKGGVLPLLDGLSAEQASSPVAADGMTMAAHAEHLRWSLANVNATVAGAAWNPNWAESWRVRAVSSAEWDTLRTSTRLEFERFRNTMKTSQTWWADPMMFSGVAATIAHAAYHLGAMRTMMKALS